MTLGFSLGQVSIEPFHEIGRRAVVDIPEADDNRRRSGVKKASNEPETRAAGPAAAKAGPAAAERDQTCGRAQVVNIEKVQRGTVQLDRTEHRIIRAERCVTRDVDEPGIRHLSAHKTFPCLTATVQTAVNQFRIAGHRRKLPEFK